MSGRKIAGASRSLQLQCIRDLNEGFLMLVLMYGSENMERERGLGLKVEEKERKNGKVEVKKKWWVSALTP